MTVFASIFLNFNLPNATTWFYFSLLLAVALFFKFSRLLSMRNWDVLTLFLAVPGLLLLLEMQLTSSDQLRGFGYGWLLCASAYFLLRCLVDLALVRRPSLSPNLNLGGLAWLGGALFVSLIAVAIRQPSEPRDKSVIVPVAMKQVQEQVQHQGEKLFQAQMDEQPDSFEAHIWVERTLAILCHLAIVMGLIFVGWRHFQDVQAGMSAATFYLLLPYIFLLLPYTALNYGQWHHVLPMALLVWAVAAYRKPTFSGLLLGLAAGSVYFPALLFPVWFSFYRRRGAGRFTAAFVLAGGLSLLMTGVFLWRDGHLAPSLHSAFYLSDWQAWKEPRTEGFWTDVHWAYRLPVFIAYVAFLFTTAFWPSPKNLAHLLALSAALVLGIQFWYAERGGIYVLWYLPLLLLLVFRPNLSDRLPPPIPAETDWLVRLGNFLKRWTGRLLKLPVPPVRVP